MIPKNRTIIPKWKNRMLQQDKIQKTQQRTI